MQYRRRRVWTFIISVLIGLCASGVAQTVYADWAAFSPQELYEKSDLIVEGTIDEAVTELKTHEMSHDMWYTIWKVRVVRYWVADHHQTETYPEWILVKTPGALNKRVATSIDYRLDAWGDNVRLVLQQTEPVSYYTPITPKGVIPLSSKGAVAVGTQVTAQEAETWDQLLMHDQPPQVDNEQAITSNVEALREQGNPFLPTWLWAVLTVIAILLIVFPAVWFVRRIRLR